MRPTPPPPDWTDERLDAAFHARFDSATPSDLGPRLHEALATTLPISRFGRMGFGRVALAGTAAIAIVVVAMLTWTPSQRPFPNPGSSAGAGGVGTLIAPLPTAVIGADALPVSITVPGADAAQRVLPVEVAIGIPDTKDPGREIVVGGWYAFNPVPCAAIPDPSSELENCAVDFTLLQSAPDHPEEASPNLDAPSNPPIVAVIHIVTAFTNWNPPPGDGRTHPVVVIGHFDDARAAQCPIGQRRDRCERLFVVDAPLWTSAGSIDLTAAPSTAGGHSVLSVSDAIGVRDSGSTDVIAVAGWFSAPVGVFSCPAEPADGPTWLEGRCTAGWLWLMANPEGLISKNGDEVSGRSPAGLAIQPAFEDRMWLSGNGMPNQGTQIPMPAVLIGHFNDPRSSACTGYAEESRDSVRAACMARLVVESVVWTNGNLLDTTP